MKKSEVTIVYLSGEHYTIKNVREFSFKMVSEMGFMREGDEAPANPDDPNSRIIVKYYDSSRKADIIQDMPTADIEVVIVREKGGNSIQAFRLHRQRNNATTILLGI